MGGPEHAHLVVLDLSSPGGGPCTATFWTFDRTAHELLTLYTSLAALSIQLLKGYYIPARQLARTNFLRVVTPNMWRRKHLGCYPLNAFYSIR
jgi:hypothetical protein